jgi:DNA-binding NtrC family response regulator
MVGATHTRRVDVRIVASTNRDPQKLVSKGLLREDLFYRLNVIAIAVPPLRERGDDTLLLTRRFAARFAEAFGRSTPQFSDAALRALRAYSWPGNVRELENVVQRAVVMCESDVIGIRDLPPLMRVGPARGPAPGRRLDEVEHDHIRTVLATCDGNRSRAARILGIDRKTLRSKLATH